MNDMSEKNPEEVEVPSRAEKTTKICMAVLVGVVGIWSLVGLSYCGIGEITNNHRLVRTGTNILEPLMFMLMATVISMLTIGAIGSIFFTKPNNPNNKN